MIVTEAMIYAGKRAGDFSGRATASELRAIYLAMHNAAIVDGSPQGRDGEARLDAKHDSDGAKQSPKTSHLTIQEGTDNGK